MKRLPINIRPLLLVPKTQNPKALALFLMAFIKLRKTGFLDNDELIDLMIQRLINLRSPSHMVATNGLAASDRHLTVNRQPSTASRYCCWGYSFPWQTRTVLVPRDYPNLVCTVFVAGALLDAYETIHESSCLEMALSAARYIVNELYWNKGNKVGFSYPLPSLNEDVVHNANFLAAAFLCRVYSHTGDERFLKPALLAARYSAGKQDHNGAWNYGESRVQKWVDNFHTGFNLCALKEIELYSGQTEFGEVLSRGFSFYKQNFFEDGKIPKYFHNKKYPIDSHSIAQSLITLSEMQHLEENTDLIQAVYSWTIQNMLDDKGYFYYQIQPFYKNRISYMRWSQAWMLNALACIFEKMVNIE